MLSSPPRETSRWESMLTMASNRGPSPETVSVTCEWMLWIIARIFGCRARFLVPDSLRFPAKSAGPPALAASVSRASGFFRRLDRYGRDHLAVGVVGDVDLLR